MTTFICLIFFGVGVSYSEEIPQRLDGRVVRADESKRLLFIGFDHPATGEHIEKEFVVAEEAGFKDFKKLSDLKEGDLISLDYYDYQPIAKAIYVIHIPLEKVYFTHKEIAQALVTVKTNQKDRNVSDS